MTSEAGSPVMRRPPRDDAAARAALADRMVAVSCELACLVRDSDRDAIGEFLAPLSAREMQALVVVQAAMIPDDRPLGDLLAWVGWDGDPVPGQPELDLEFAQPGRDVQPCGTYAAYSRHKDRGEETDAGCQAAARAYWAQRGRARREAARLGPEAGAAAAPVQGHPEHPAMPATAATAPSVTVPEGGRSAA